MVKDEMGFLSEWVAFHLMQGIDHIRFYDDASWHNETFAELAPWIADGSVSIQPANIQQGLKFNGMMRAKGLTEALCKDYAFDNGFDLFISLDLDEYLMPQNSKITAVEELWNMLETSGLYSARIAKYNFNSVPHLLEPVNLLTIEAFQSRMPTTDAMTYFKSIAPKLALRMSGPAYQHENRTLLKNYVKSCTFHGCHYARRPPFNALDTHPYLFLTYGRRGLVVPYINHYSRSLEKFGLKAQSWRTAGKDQTEYTLNHFFDRSVGWVLDNRAMRFGCQVREILRNKTKDHVYFRPGAFWYRNTEFGRQMTAPEKGKRSGEPVKPNEKKVYFHPYHYHGREWPFVDQAEQYEKSRQKEGSR